MRSGTPRWSYGVSRPRRIRRLDLNRVEGDRLNGLTIGEFAARTGVAEGTLRMWERRHGFPTPQRSARGQRRYGEADVELVRRVASERSGGVSLAAAIGRARRDVTGPASSVYAALRRDRPELEPRTLRKPLLLALTRAIEDESLLRGGRPLLFASFQRERYYRQAQGRWGELSWGAELSVVFADFDRVGMPAGAPVEVPVDRSHPLAREWTVVCCAADHAVCLTAWEPPASDGRAGRDRVFESIWSVEPAVVWQAARICAGIAAPSVGGLIDSVRDRLERDPEPGLPEQVKLSAAITGRLLSYLS